MTDAEVSNGMPLITPALLPLPADDVGPGRASAEVVETHRASHAQGVHNVPPPASAVTSVIGALQTRPDLTDFRELLAEAQVPLPVDESKIMALAISNETLRQMPKARLDKLRADKGALRRTLSCHLDPIGCFKVKGLKLETSDDGPVMRFGNLLARVSTGQKFADGVLLLVDDFAAPPKDFRPARR